MNKFLLLFFAVVMASFVSASQVEVLNFHYEDGFISVKDRTVKLGYYPDKNFQPDDGYRIEVISESGVSLYSYRFRLPIEIFTDKVDGDKLSGGLIRLNETDFSIIIPYFPDAKEIIFYNSRNYKITTVDISEEQFSPPKLDWVWYLGGIMIIIMAVYLIKKKNN